MDDAINHIQFERDFDMIHFKNWQMMLNFLNIIYANFDFIRKIRNKFRILIMNIQNFQTFFSIFLRLNVSIKYIEIVKLKKLYEKLSLKLKNALIVYFREFATLIGTRKEFTLIYNKQKSFRKEKIFTRLLRLDFIHFKFNSIILISIIFFTKFVTSFFFTKLFVHFVIERKSFDFAIEKLIDTNNCFICEKSKHTWKFCLNKHKHKKRQWYDLQMIVINYVIEFDDSNSKNWKFTSKTRLMNV